MSSVSSFTRGDASERGQRVRFSVINCSMGGEDTVSIQSLFHAWMSISRQTVEPSVLSLRYVAAWATFQPRRLQVM